MGIRSIRQFITPRLQLRPLAASDEALYCRLYTDPGIMRHIGAPLSATAACAAFLAACRQATAANPATQIWAIDREAASVGIAACVRSPAIRDEAELGLMLVPEAQGVGLAVEALTALTACVFASCRLRRVWTRHAPENLAALRLMRTMRFTQELTTADEVRWQMHFTQWQGLHPLGRLREWNACQT